MGTRTVRKLLVFVAGSLTCLSVLLAATVTSQYGQRVDAGGHGLRMRVAGRGTPTVVLETSGMAPLEAWILVQRGVATFTQVVAYDHAGYWGSEPGPKPRDARRITEELHSGLHRAKLPPPYVLVGYSFGGPFIRVFAHRYPEEIAGLVFVDPSQEECLEWLQTHLPEVNRITEADVARQDEWGCSWATLNQARAAWPLPKVPVTLITCVRDDGNSLLAEILPIWVDSHKAWLKRVPNATHIITEKSDHGIIVEEPELVIEAIRSVVEQARKRSEG